MGWRSPYPNGSSSLSLGTRGGLSIYEVARAIHLSDVCRAEVVTWINQFAVPPEEQEDHAFPNG